MPADLALRCQQEDLQRALRAVARAIPSNPTLPVLANVLLRASGGAVTVTGYDLALGVEAPASGASVEAHGAALVPFGLLAGLVDRLPALEVALKAAGGQIEVRCGSGLYRLPTDDQAVPEDFPVLPEGPGEDAGLALPAAALQEALKGLAGVCGKGDDGRPFLTGVALSAGAATVEAIAGSGHLFGCSTVAVGAGIGADQPPVLLPGALARELERLEGDVVHLAVGGGILSARCGDARIVGNLMAETYPLIKNALPPKYDNSVDIERDTLKDALERLRLFAQLEQDTVILKISENDIAIAAEAGGASGAELVPCKNGPSSGMKIAFGAAILLQAIKGLPGYRLTMQFNSPTGPALFTAGENSSRQYIVMPRAVK